MKKLTTSELRKSYLDYFVVRGHRLVKSDSLVPTADPSVLFTSAGMNQFKDYFLGKLKDFSKATSCQKCLRTGDLEEVGRTPFHHTFFEMLGNFSFGDYFKKEAIEWGWDFVTNVLDIDQARLWVSVYEDDEEAFDLWHKHIGLPEDKIKRMGQKDNFWPSNAIKDGPNGPCGPCSEIYYEKDNGESVEVWNLVFTQFNRCDGGVLEPLPNKNIDTGMGLERMSSVLQGVDSNFKIDVFLPIVESVKKVSQIKEEKSINMVADHVRAVTFCIADGVLPSNDGRGYVVRKLIRRCLSFNQTDKPEPFLYKIVSSVATSMADQYPEISQRRDNIASIIKAEEERYIRNILEGGAGRLSERIEQYKKSGKTEVDAESVVDLYVTYGIPSDVAIEAFGKAGLSVNLEEIDRLMKEEQEKSRDASKISASIFSADSVVFKRSKFVGYEMDFSESTVVQILKDGKEVNEAELSGELAIVLDDTPFYGESGGQVGDTGIIKIKANNFEMKVTDTKKEGDSIIHKVKCAKPVGVIKTGDVVFAEVDKIHRDAVKRAHTATHILQAVLRKVLGEHVQQAGSFVEPDRFRFDFTHFKDISAEDLERIQQYLNEFVIKNDRLNFKFMAKSEAQKTGAIALFGEKYEDTVRVVSIGDYSKEFCGGTHLDYTGRIGLIVITSESSVGSGLRRIEALTGRLAYAKASSTFDVIEDASEKLKTRPAQFLGALDQLIARQKNLEKQILALQEKNLISTISDLKAKIKENGGYNFLVHKFNNLDPSLLRRAIDIMKEEYPERSVFLLASVGEDSANFACGTGSGIKSDALSANALLKNILNVAGGSGGGRKDFAQGGTKQIDKVDLALSQAERVILDSIFRELKDEDNQS